MKKRYDVVIIGSGIGGLASAVILAKEGLSVCVLEKNRQFGGNLQTFSRNKTIFDTGVHYIGGLDKNQNLHQYFSYLGIMDHLKLVKMNENAYDLISFGDTDIRYPHAQGYENFIQQLLVYFPEEEQALRTYCQKIQEICNSFPMYNLEEGKIYDDRIVSYKLIDFLNDITTNETLQSVLIGSNFLYVADKEKTPLYVHALTVNSYIQSAWRCINGGSQISKLLIKQLKKHGGEVVKGAEVVAFELDGKKVTSCETHTGEKYYGEQFISNINLKQTIRMVGKENFSRPFVNRIMSLEEVTSAFSLYIIFKENSFPYQNSNLYHYNTMDEVWDVHGKCDENWPSLLVSSFNAKEENQEFAESMTVMSYMDFSEVEPWSNTKNVSTIKKLKTRSADYELFKKEKAEVILKKLEELYPGISSCIDNYYTSTPLTYRDFIGSEKGNMYGFIKDANSPMRTFISPRSKIGNLFFCGQNVRMHGVMGVTIGAFATCMEMVDKESLIRKIQKVKNESIA